MKGLLLSILIILVILTSFLIGNQVNNTLKIDELKYLYICEDESALILSWTTTQPTKCVVTWCSSEDICMGSDKEQEFSLLHLTIIPAEANISYYTIVIENKTGEIRTKKLDR